MRNSIDAVADRDFALDYLYAAAVLFTHLSRIGEELVLWTTAEFGFARLPEDAATGSSMMPQKLNPDVAELARGKAGTAIGRLTGLLATVKGLPLAYDRDLQEDKAPVFAARADVRGALAALAVLVARTRLRSRPAGCGCADPLLRATDAAEALVREGVPFRDAHEQVAAQVRAGHVRRRRLRRDSAMSGRRSRRRKSGGRDETPLPVSLAGRDFLRVSDLVAGRGRGDPRPRGRAQARPGAAASREDARSLLRASPRRGRAISFSVAIAQLGGAAVTLAPGEMQLSRGESLQDTGEVLSRYLDGLAIRTHSHAELEAWARRGPRSR